MGSGGARIGAGRKKKHQGPSTEELQASIRSLQRDNDKLQRQLSSIATSVAPVSVEPSNRGMLLSLRGYCSISDRA